MKNEDVFNASNPYFNENDLLSIYNIENDQKDIENLIFPSNLLQDINKGHEENTLAARKSTQQEKEINFSPILEPINLSTQHEFSPKHKVNVVMPSGDAKSYPEGNTKAGKYYSSSLYTDLSDQIGKTTEKPDAKETMKEINTKTRLQMNREEMKKREKDEIKVNSYKGRSYEKGKFKESEKERAISRTKSGNKSPHGGMNQNKFLVQKVQNELLNNPSVSNISSPKKKFIVDAIDLTCSEKSSTKIKDDMKDVVFNFKVDNFNCIVGDSTMPRGGRNNNSNNQNQNHNQNSNHDRTKHINSKEHIYTFTLPDFVDIIISDFRKLSEEYSHNKMLNFLSCIDSSINIEKNFICQYIKFRDIVMKYDPKVTADVLFYYIWLHKNIIESSKKQSNSIRILIEEKGVYRETENVSSLDNSFDIKQQAAFPQKNKKTGNDNNLSTPFFAQEHKGTSDVRSDCLYQSQRNPKDRGLLEGSKRNFTPDVIQDKSGMSRSHFPEKRSKSKSEIRVSQKTGNKEKDAQRHENIHKDNHRAKEQLSDTTQTETVKSDVRKKKKDTSHTQNRNMTDAFAQVIPHQKDFLKKKRCQESKGKSPILQCNNSKKHREDPEDADATIYQLNLQTKSPTLVQCLPKEKIQSMIDNDEKFNMIKKILPTIKSRESLEKCGLKNLIEKEKYEAIVAVMSGKSKKNLDIEVYSTNYYRVNLSLDLRKNIIQSRQILKNTASS